MRNLIKKKPLVGTWCIVPSAHVINVIAKTNLDFLIIDMEHGSCSFSEAQNMVQSAQAENTKVIIRVSTNSESEILKALDTGCDGIIVPHISNKKQIDSALTFMHYYPEGARGYSPFTRAGGYHFNKDYTKNENQRILKGIIIEDQEALDNIDIILADERLDLVYIGAYDISISIGFPGQISHEKVQEKILFCIEKIKQYNKIAGCMIHSKKEYEQYRNLGVTFLVYKVDTQIIYENYNQFMDGVK